MLVAIWNLRFDNNKVFTQISTPLKRRLDSIFGKEIALDRYSLCSLCHWTPHSQALRVCLLREEERGPWEQNFPQATEINIDYVTNNLWVAISFFLQIKLS